MRKRVDVSDIASRTIGRLIAEDPGYIPPALNPKKLEANYEQWFRTLFPAYTRRPFADFHHELLEWFWALEPGVRPDPFFAIWFRAGAKSTIGELGIVSAGARHKRKYGLYISATQTTANNHLMSIRDMLEGSKIARYYPELSKPRVGSRGQQLGFNAQRLWTSGDFVVDAYGLDAALRGIKLEEQRPDLLILDDIDEEKDSELVVQSKIAAITSKILPAGSPDVAVVGLQNLVHRNSIFRRIQTRQADFLQNRVISGPVPMLEQEKIELVGGKWKIADGRPRWPSMSMDDCQRLLDDWGHRAFLVEAQHQVDQAYEGALFPSFDEKIHLITKSEFRRVYSEWLKPGEIVPGKGFKYFAMDFGTTRAHPCACLWAWQPREGMPNTDSVIFYRELVRPSFPGGKDVEVVAPLQIGKRIQDLERATGEEILWRIGSHEAAGVRNSFVHDLPQIPGYEALLISAIQTNQGDQGVSTLQDLLLVDPELRHPFRVDPATGNPLAGRPRLYLLVDDRQGALYYDEAGKLAVMAARDEGGFARTRWEFPRYRHRISPGGEEGKDPRKIDDDAMDAAIALLAKRRSVEPVSPKEREIQRYFGQSQKAHRAAGPQYGDMTYQYRRAAMQRIERQVEEGNYQGRIHPDDDDFDPDDDPNPPSWQRDWDGGGSFEY